MIIILRLLITYTSLLIFKDLFLQNISFLLQKDFSECLQHEKMYSVLFLAREDVYSRVWKKAQTMKKQDL